MPLGSFTAAWLEGEPRAVALLHDGFRRPEDRARAVRTAAARRIAPQVLDTLQATTEQQRAHREALAAGGAAVVVTGQQAGLFGGPLYTLYKAAAAIVDAAALAEQTGVPCVPLFWLQNEDHDFDEIAASHVPAGSELHTLRVAGDGGDRRRSVAAVQWSEGVGEALDGLQSLLTGQPGAADVMALLRRTYQPAASPADSLRDWIEALFAEHGLLVVDPSLPPVVEAAASLHASAIEHAEAWARALGARTQQLKAAGFRVQVHVRPDSPLSFVHPHGRGGPRFRVERRGAPEGHWQLCGTRDTVPDDVVRAGPHSTSALLRPLLQDTLLPTAAYVGGPGEIAYFAQLPPLYEAAGVPMPLVVPRARFRVVDAGTDRLLQQLGLVADDLAGPRDALVARLARPVSDAPDPEALRAALTPLEEALARFAPHAEAMDPGLAKAARKTEATARDAVGKLVERYRRTLGQRDATAMERLERVMVRLQPGGSPQERVHGWPWYGARYGVGCFVRAVIDAVVPFDGAMQELRVPTPGAV
ncbi:MAG: bacillithiol biosynthesis cysteine-adding enzyme BshC [Myxococcales bacterium]|nr:bacillithiol biosynthesis cysteine-adding enzyme BshC [Myxococcales bacterium]